MGSNVIVFCYGKGYFDPLRNILQTPKQLLLFAALSLPVLLRCVPDWSPNLPHLEAVYELLEAWPKASEPEESLVLLTSRYAHLCEQPQLVVTFFLWNFAASRTRVCAPLPSGGWEWPKTWKLPYGCLNWCKLFAVNSATTVPWPDSCFNVL